MLPNPPKLPPPIFPNPPPFRPPRPVLPPKPVRPAKPVVPPCGPPGPLVLVATHWPPAICAPQGPYVPTQHGVPFVTGGHSDATHGVVFWVPPAPMPLTAPPPMGTPAPPPPTPNVSPPVEVELAVDVSSS